MRAGQLRHRVAVQSATQTTNDAGDPIRTWSTTAAVWARVEPLSGREAERARAIRADLTHKVTIRGGVTLTPAMRFLFGSRVLNVGHVLDAEERGITLQAYCTEVAVGS